MGAGFPFFPLVAFFLPDSVLSEEYLFIFQLFRTILGHIRKTLYVYHFATLCSFSTR